MLLEKYNKTTRLIIVVAMAVLIWVIGVIIGQEQAISIISPEGGLFNIITRTHTISVSLMLDDGQGQVKVFKDDSFIYGKSVLDLLQKLDTQQKLSLKIKQNKDSGAISSFILNDLASQEQGKKWLVWINHQLQTEPINKDLLKAHDFIELKYINLNN